MARAIRLSAATPHQLRQFIAERFDEKHHHKVGKAKLLRRLQELNYHDQTIELSDEADEAAQQDAQDEARVFSSETMLQAPEEERQNIMVQALVMQGLSEEDANALIGSFAKPSGSGREGRKSLPDGADCDQYWCTIRLAPGQGEGGDEPAFFGVNGVGQWIPRGKDVEVRVPYVHAIYAAERLEYDERPSPDGMTRLHVPRPVLQYPIEFCSEPYKRADAPPSPFADAMAA